MEKQKIQVRRANLFFIELLIALLFFSISAVIMLRVFAAADNKQKTAALTEKSIICAQSLAEVYSVSGNLSRSVYMTLGVDGVSGDELTLVLDDELSPAESGAVQLTMQETVLGDTAAGRLSQLDIAFTAGETELYSLTCKAYVPLEM